MKSSDGIVLPKTHDCFNILVGMKQKMMGLLKAKLLLYQVPLFVRLLMLDTWLKVLNHSQHCEICHILYYLILCTFVEYCEG